MNKKERFEEMFKKERKEHPTLSNKAIKTIVKDHMKEKEYRKKAKKIYCGGKK